MKVGVCFENDDRICLDTQKNLEINVGLIWRGIFVKGLLGNLGQTGLSLKSKYGLICR